MNKSSEAAAALRRALDLGAERRRLNPDARDLAAEVRKDARFNKLRDDPQFQQLLRAR